MEQVKLLEAEYQKNSESGLNSQIAFGTESFKLSKKTMVATLDFSVLGGAVGALTLKDPNGKNAILPKGAVITSAMLDVITAPTSGGSATIAFGTGQAANDLKTATAIASLTGIVACIPVGTAATAIKLTADSTMSATVATAALTACKINVLVEYYVSSTT
jgi:hypothetical protein